MTGRDPYEVAAERVERRTRQSRIDALTAHWWLDCLTHGHAPVDPYKAGACFYCGLDWKGWP